MTMFNYPKDLVFIAEHLTTWPDEYFTHVRLDYDGEIAFTPEPEGDDYPDFYVEDNRNQYGTICADGHIVTHPAFIPKLVGLFGKEYSKEEWVEARNAITSIEEPDHD